MNGNWALFSIDQATDKVRAIAVFVSKKKECLI
jgi:hypothetical protein